MKTNIALRLALALAGGALALSACALDVGGEPMEEEQVGTAAQAQIDGGFRFWRSYAILLPSGAELARINVVNATACGFNAGTEYWYVDRDNLSQLGTSSLTITSTEGPSTYPPDPCFPPDPCNPGPGVPPDPCYVHEQAFTQPTNPAGGWGTGWTTDPASGGSLYAMSGGKGLRLSRSTLNPPTLTKVTWYQVISSGATPQNINPTGALSLTSAISVPPGYLGYDISRRP